MENSEKIPGMIKLAILAMDALDKAGLLKEEDKQQFEAAKKEAFKEIGIKPDSTPA